MGVSLVRHCIFVWKFHINKFWVMKILSIEVRNSLDQEFGKCFLRLISVRLDDARQNGTCSSTLNDCVFTEQTYPAIANILVWSISWLTSLLWSITRWIWPHTSFISSCYVYWGMYSKRTSHMGSFCVFPQTISLHLIIVDVNGPCMY